MNYIDKIPIRKIGNNDWVIKVNYNNHINLQSLKHNTIDLRNGVLKTGNKAIITDLHKKNNNTALKTYNKHQKIKPRAKVLYFMDKTLIWFIKIVTESILYITLNINNWLDSYILNRKYKLWLFNFTLNKNDFINIALKIWDESMSLEDIQIKYKLSHNNAKQLKYFLYQVKKYELVSKLKLTYGT